MSKNQLIQLIKNSGHRLCAPLAGFPGATLTATTIRENLSNAKTQCASLLALTEQINPDIIMVMMDLSVECEALGLDVRLPENESPTVESHPVITPSDLTNLKPFDTEQSRIKIFLDTTSALKKNSELPVCAYICGPFTLAGLLMGATEIMMASYDNISNVKEIIDFCSTVAEEYALALESHGADAVCILDPTAMMLSPDTFLELAGKPVKKLSDRLKIPAILHICGNTTHLIDRMSATGVQGLSLDMDVNIPEILKHVDKNLVIMGNIDSKTHLPSGTLEDIERQTGNLMAATDGFDNFIAASGCDLPPETPIENIIAFSRTVKNYKKSTFNHEH